MEEAINVVISIVATSVLDVPGIRAINVPVAVAAISIAFRIISAATQYP